MLRLAVFVLAVLLLFRAGSHEAAPPRAAPVAPPGSGFATARVAAPPLRPLAPVILPGGSDDAPPAPFDASATTTVDPASLPASPHRAQRAGARQLWRVTAERLALRAGPSDLYPAVGALLRGDLASGTASDQAGWLWLRSDAAGTAGFAPADRLTPWPPARQPAAQH